MEQRSVLRGGVDDDISDVEVGAVGLLLAGIVANRGGCDAYV